MPSVGQYSVFKQTKKEKKKVIICLWSLPTELSLFCQDVSFFTPFLGTCSIQVRKAKPDQQKHFFNAPSEARP